MGRSLHVSYLWVLLAASASSIFSTQASAEFSVWRAAGGQRQISNIPAHGFTADGELRRSYHPNSIAFQHARMLDTLAAQEKQMLFERTIQDNTARDNHRLAASPLTRAPGNGLMNLDELIGLEKRSSRVAPESTVEYQADD
jgi:hypothetical protein